MADEAAYPIPLSLDLATRQKNYRKTACNDSLQAVFVNFNTHSLPQVLLALGVGGHKVVVKGIVGAGYGNA